MRDITLVVFVMSAVCAGVASGRESNRPYKQLPDKEVEAKIRSLDVDAISEAGERKGPSTKAALAEVSDIENWSDADRKKYEAAGVSSNPKLKEQIVAQRVIARHKARLALAKMGEKKYIRGFLDDLNSPDDMKKAGAINALGSIGDRRTVKYVIPFLDKNESPKFKPGKQGPAPFPELAEQALEKILPDILAQFRKENPGRRFYFKGEWKAWWAKNKDNYKEGLE